MLIAGFVDYFDFMIKQKGRKRCSPTFFSWGLEQKGPKRLTMKQKKRAEEKQVVGLEQKGPKMLDHEAEMREQRCWTTGSLP